MEREEPGTTAPSELSRRLLEAPTLAHDIEYARGKAAVTAALFGGPPLRQHIGRYELLRRLGKGGMGEVYAARDPLLGREVALKLARPRSSTVTSADDAQLLREAQLLARLSHPNIVPIHEVGVFGDRVYIAMALVRGQTLRRWQEGEERPWRAILRVYLAAARGLAAAHAAGLVHCDFKPDNVLIDGEENVYVVDFGLARATDNDLAMTVEGPRGSIGGTPGYIAPEQHSGAALDHRSDVYSVACSLFEALHGQLPGRRPEAGFELRRGRRASHPRRIDRAIERGLAEDPQHRYPSLDALIDALELEPRRVTRRIVLVCTLVGLGAVAGSLAAREPLATDACAAIERDLEQVWASAPRRAVISRFAASQRPLAALSWSTTDHAVAELVDEWKATRRTLCDVDEPGPRADEPAMRCLARGVFALTSVVDRLRVADATTVELAVSAVDALPRAERCRSGDAGGPAARPPAQVEAAEALHHRLLIARAHAATGDQRGALRLAEEVLADAEGLGDSASWIAASIEVGELRGRRGQLNSAESSLLDAVDRAEAERLDDLAASAWIALATLAARQQVAPERALLWIRRATAALDRAGDRGPRRTALINAAGVAAAHAGRHGEAEQAHRGALTLALALRGAEHERLRALQGLGNALESLSRVEEARSVFDEALALAERRYGPHHPSYARIAHDMATVLIAQGEEGRARQLLEQALTTWAEAQGGESIESGRVHTSLAHQAAQAGELERAEHHSDRALAIYRELLPADHEDLPAAWLNLGAIAHWRGDYAKALSAYREAEALQARSLPADHHHRAITANNIGESLLALGRADEALAAFAVAEPIARAATTVDLMLLCLILRGKGTALLGLDRGSSARAALEEARGFALRDHADDTVAELDLMLAKLGPAIASAPQKNRRRP